MTETIAPLTPKDLSAAAHLDQKWFGEHGATVTQLNQHIQKHPDKGLVLRLGDNLKGFTTFELLTNQSPTDYVGQLPKVDHILFIQQFTTTTNYAIADSSADSRLLKAVEEYAQKNQCREVWEALAVKHPYSQAVNPVYDAFGFYESNGYSYDRNSVICWSPDPSISIPCYLFRKQIAVEE